MTDGRTPLLVLAVAAGLGCAPAPSPGAGPTADPAAPPPQAPPVDDAKPSRQELARTLVASNAFYYYRDLPRAQRFYTEVLGFAVAADYGFAKILQVAPTSYLTLVDASKGMHTADEPKTVAMAILTDELEGWWDYLQGGGVTMKYPLKVKPDGPHDGFVAIDPEGYLLEFERFNPHPENERLMPILGAVEPLRGVPVEGTRRPAQLGVKGTVVWLYYAELPPLERFYEEVLGLPQIVDQGWAKVYPTSATGFLGLVDGAKGMHKPTDEKGVTISFITSDVDAWFDALANDPRVELRKRTVETESDAVRQFVGYDPGGYFLEFDRFLPVPRNAELPFAAAG